MARCIDAVAVLALLVGQGCVLSPVELETKRCPCAPGWVCDEERDRCVPEGLDAAQTTPETGSPDSGTIEDPGFDAAVAPVDDPTTACDDELLADAMFCESFEDHSLLHWRVREAYDGTVGHTRERAFRGLGSLLARSTEPGGYAERIAEVVGGISEGDIFVRAYVLIPDGAPLVHANLLHVGGHRSRSATEPLAGFNVVDGFAAMYIGAGNFSLRPELVEVPRDRWFCVQYELHVDDTAGVARLWIDGELAGEALDIDTRTEQPYVSFGAGIAWAELAQEPFEVAIDELAIGRTPLPCE